MICKLKILLLYRDKFCYLNTFVTVMKERIRQIMENAHLTPSAFADNLQVGRAVISHILNGRNNPSLDIVTRILAKMNNIDPEWLLTGKGEMYRQISNENSNHNTQKTLSPINPIVDTIPTSNNSSADLFTPNTLNPSKEYISKEYVQDSVINKTELSANMLKDDQAVYKKTCDKKVSKIIIYYTDNTFETFITDKTPL